MLMVGWPGTGVPDSLRALLDEPLVSGVIWFSRNVVDTGQVARVNDELRSRRPDLLIAVDQEGGPVRRLKTGVTEICAMRDVVDADQARHFGQVLGAELSALGFNMNMAPVLDVDSNPANPVIGQRSFSRDPLEVAARGIALHEGLMSQGVISCGKHFPGHGDTDLDSHLALPRITHSRDRLDAVELVPFRAAIAAGIPAIMSAHILIEALDRQHPATLSHAAMTGLLRNALGFEGVIVSDDLEMQAVADRYAPAELARLGLDAGLDLLLVCHDLAKQHAMLEVLEQRDTSEQQARLARLLDIRG